MIRGIVRNLDKLGRAVPPMEFRRALGINNEEPVDMYLGGKAIRIRKAERPYKGMVRETDHLGRITLPIEYRRSLKMDICSPVDIYIEDDEICTRKANLQCVICGSEDESQLMDIDGVLICRDCGCKVVDKFMED